MKRKMLCAMVIACLMSCVGIASPYRQGFADAASTWVERTPAGDFSRNWLACASDAAGQRLLAGDNGGRLWISLDAGASWAEAEQIKMTPGTRLVEGGVLVTSCEGQQLRIPCDSAAGRLARETLRSLKFFRSQFAEGSYLGMVGAATLSGGGALLRGIDASIQEQGIEVTSTINPFAGFSVAAESGIQDIGASSPAYTTAVGLALGDYWTEEEVADEVETAA